MVNIAIFFGIDADLFNYINKKWRKNDTKFAIVFETDRKKYVSHIDAIVKSHLPIKIFLDLPVEDAYSVLYSFLVEQNRFVWFPTAEVFGPNVKSNYAKAMTGMLIVALRLAILRYGNDPEDSLIGISNMFHNINEIINNPGINMLKDTFKDKPAIVVATGPSLTKQLPLLKELQDKAVIIAADASLKPLLEFGIRPHLVASLERIPETVAMLNRWKDDELDGIYLAACPVVPKEVYMGYPGPRVIVYRNFDHFKWLDIERGILQVEQSSGNMAFKIAEELGCNPIALVGQDLAFVGDKTHADDAPLFEGESQNHLNMSRIKVPGNVEPEVETHQIWYDCLKAYEHDLKMYQGKCYNCTEGGAKIQGATIGTLKEFSSLCEAPASSIRQTITDTLASFTPSSTEHLLGKIDSAIQEANEIMQLCSEGIEKNMPELREMVFSKQCILPLLMHFTQAYHIQFEMSLSNGYNVSHQEWFAVMGDLTNVLRGELINARHAIEHGRV